MKKLISTLVVLVVATFAMAQTSAGTGGNVDNLGNNASKPHDERPVQIAEQQIQTPVIAPTEFVAGPQGPAGKAGKPANSQGIYRELKRWNPASVSHVDAKLNKLANWTAANYAAKTNPTNFPPAGPPAKTASQGAQTAAAPGETNMWNPLTATWIIVGLLLIFSIGHWIWGNLVHNRGLLDQNHVQSQSFDPHQKTHSVFVTETTKQRHLLRVTPSDVAIAQAQAEAEVAHCRMTEAALARRARGEERQALVASLFQSPPQLVLVGANGGGYIPQMPVGGSEASTPPKEDSFTIEQLKKLGVIKNEPPKAPPTTTPPANPKAKQGQGKQAAP